MPKASETVSGNAMTAEEWKEWGKGEVAEERE
jgi:hypothetical protein